MNRLKFPLSVAVILGATSFSGFAEPLEICTELDDFTKPEYKGGPIPDDDPRGRDYSLDTTGLSGKILDLDVRVIVDNHPFTGDLVATLRRGSAAEVTLISRPSNGECQSQSGGGGIDVWLDDEANTAVDDQCEDTIKGIHSPTESLSGFDGEEFEGIWTMNVADLDPTFDGTFLGFCLKANASGDTPILGDLDSDGDVDFTDLFTFEGWFFSGDSRGDFDNDGDVDFSDLFIFEGYWNIAHP